MTLRKERERIVEIRRDLGVENITLKAGKAGCAGITDG